MLTPTNLQRQTLRLYGELISRADTRSGQLIFTCGAASSATGLPVAVSIAGGTTLALDPDAAAVKATFRQGGIDFVVNTLDEALRVLKNEIRQHRPLSVGLISDLQPVVAEMLERGVTPDLQITIDDAAHPLPGIAQLHLTTLSGLIQPTAHLTRWLAARALTETLIEPTTNLRALDATLIAALPANDTARRLWLQRISHYQRATPGTPRIAWLTS